MEMGFYDEDLPCLILQIVDINNKLNCNSNLGHQDDEVWEIYYRFFPGTFIANTYNNNQSFRNSVTSAVDEIVIPYLGETINGEKILRIEIDGLSIPLEEVPVVSDP